MSKTIVHVWDYEGKVMEVEMPKKMDDLTYLAMAKGDYCYNCSTVLGLDCGEAEPDYNQHFCSVGCYNEFINNNVVRREG